MTIAGSIKLTADQYLALGEDPPLTRLELVNGEIFVSPSPSYHHNQIIFRLLLLLGNHVARHDLGDIVSDTDTIFDDSNVRRPDIIFIAKSRLKLRTGTHVNIAPDLCVEVLSPGSVTTDGSDKFALYEKHRVAHYWLVDPRARTVECHILKKNRYILAAQGRGKETVCFPPFADLAIPLVELWRR